MVNCIAPTVRDLAELLEAYTGTAKVYVDGTYNQALITQTSATGIAVVYRDWETQNRPKKK